MKKIYLLLLLFLSFWIGLSQDYIFFYGNWCTHCAKVEEFFKENEIDNIFSIQRKEIYFNNTNRKEFLEYGEKLWIPSENLWVPLLIVNNENTCSNLIWDQKIINYFNEKIVKVNISKSPDTCTTKELDTGVIKIYDETTMPKHKTTDPIIIKTQEPELEIIDITNWSDTINSWIMVENNTLNTKESQKKTFKDRLSFFAIMLLAAISDSINPCEFTIIILLLWTILIKTKSRRRAIFTWLAFSLSIFVSYFLLWLGLWKMFSSTTNTNLIKIIAGSLGILVWLANLKDVFWYGKWFVMEVPFSWRTRLKAFVQSITSPIGAFFIGIIVSLFLLPCTSWPYITILTYLSSESIERIWGLVYLFIYNIFFILPMVVITILVSYWMSDIEKLNILKDKYNRLIHLVVWLLMLGLWAYVFLTM